MCVLIAVNQLGFGAVIPVLPLYAKSFDVSQTAIGATVAVYGVARVFLGLPTGKAADLLGRRTALAVGGGVTVLGNLWCALASTYLELLMARLIAGAGAGIVLTAGLIVLADIASPTTRGRTLAIYQGVFLFAVGIGPFPGGFLAERFALEAPFLVYAIMGAAVTAVAWFGVPETRGLGGTLPGAGKTVRLREQVRALLGNIGFRLVCLIGLVGALARTGGLFSIVPILGRERLSLSATEIGFAFALGSIVGLLVTYPAGFMADRFGRKAVIVPATVLIGISMLAFSLAPDYAWFLAACLIWGGAITASGAAPAAYAVDAAPEGMNAAAMGSYRMLSDVGYVVGPILLGWLGDAGGLDLPLWTAAGSLFLMAALFGLFASETVRDRA
ncbi:MAG: MFS transporter [Gammaproteobacteria bacterium]|nr:MFS transporter [Gammaproteobacteria bacterium]